MTRGTWEQDVKKIFKRTKAADRLLIEWLEFWSYEGQIPFAARDCLQLYLELRRVNKA